MSAQPTAMEVDVCKCVEVTAGSGYLMDQGSYMRNEMLGVMPFSMGIFPCLFPSTELGKVLVFLGLHVDWGSVRTGM